MIIVVVGAILMFVVGVGFVGTGIQNRREDGPADGAVLMSIGSVFLSLAVVVGFAAEFVGNNDDAPPGNSTAAETSNDVYSALQGTDKYLRSIEDVQLSFDGTVGPKMTFSFTGDDASGQVRTDSGKVDVLRVDGETYMRPEDKFYGPDGEAAIGQIDGRWLHVDIGNQVLGSLVPFADRERLRLVLNERQRYVRSDSKRIGEVDCSGFKSKLTRTTIYIEEGMSQYKLLQIVYSDGSVGTLAYEDSGTAPVKPNRVVDIDEIFQNSAA